MASGYGRPRSVQKYQRRSVTASQYFYFASCDGRLFGGMLRHFPSCLVIGQLFMYLTIKGLPVHRPDGRATEI